MGPALQLFQKLLDGESRGAGAGHGVGHDLAKLSLAFDIGAGHFLPTDECAGSLVGFKLPAEFEFLIRSDHGIGIDGEIDGELTDGWKLVAGNESPGSNGSAGLVDDLPVDWDAAMQVEMEAECGFDWGSHR
jgi:hypothetical protein